MSFTPNAEKNLWKNQLEELSFIDYMNFQTLHKFTVISFLD